MIYLFVVWVFFCRKHDFLVMSDLHYFSLFDRFTAFYLGNIGYNLGIVGLCSWRLSKLYCINMNQKHTSPVATQVENIC